MAAHDSQQDTIDENQQETVPVSLIFSCRDNAGAWSEPQRPAFLQPAPDHEQSHVIHELLDLSETIYGEFPHSSTFLIDKRNEHGIRIVHASMRRAGDDRFRGYASVPQ